MTLTPKIATVAVNGTQQFTAAVTNTPDTAVIWSVLEAGGGTIDSTGKYTAPGSAGVFHVVAQSHAAAGKSDVTGVIVAASSSIAPSLWTMLPGTNRVFQAPGATSWSVQESGGGSVDATGTYTAPAAPGTYHVVAHLSGGGSATAAVTVSTFASLRPSPNPIISRGKPVFVSGGAGATNLTDGKYYTGTWSAGYPTANTPAWAAIHLGAGPTRVLFSWSASGSYNYDETDFGSPGAYQIQVSKDSTNGGDGTWTPVASNSNVTVRTQAHSFDFTGMSWVRMVVTAAASDSKNGVNLDEIDVHDLSAGGNDGWFFFGDSITAFWSDRHDNSDPTVTHQPSFAQQIANGGPGRFPAMIDGGHGGWTSNNGVQVMQQWLNLNPDFHYWGICWGMNDSAGNTSDTTAFKANMQSIIDFLKSKGRVPVLSRISYSSDGHHNYIPAFNAVIDDLTVANGLLPGPDPYPYFLAHPNELRDQIHPTDTGIRSWNNLWFGAERALYP